MRFNQQCSFKIKYNVHIYYKLFRSILKTIPPLSPKLEGSGLKGQGMNRSFFINGLPIVCVLIKILLSKMF